jgi:hypothetical protein
MRRSSEIRVRLCRRIAAMALAMVCAGYGHMSLAATDCSATSVLGDWVLQSTNRVAADRNVYSYPFLGSSLDGYRGPSVFTAVVTLAPDGSASIQDRFVRGYRAEDVQFFTSGNNSWTLGADCALEISGVISAGWSDFPHAFRLTASPDGLRVEGLREIEIDPQVHKLRYALKGGRL